MKKRVIMTILIASIVGMVLCGCGNQNKRVDKEQDDERYENTEDTEEESEFKKGDRILDKINDNIWFDSEGYGQYHVCECVVIILLMFSFAIMLVHEYAFNAKFHNARERRILEDSTGTIEIKDNKLYYYRNEIKETTLELPEVSIFEIGEDGYLTLTNNYLSKYQKEIILK